jgi:hypothetical protein
MNRLYLKKADKMHLKNYIKLGLLFLGCCLLSFAKAYSQDKDMIAQGLYSASGIPDSLKEDANSVVRYNLEEYDVRGPGKIIHKSHSIVTILNEKGQHEAEVTFGYHKKYSSVSSFEMRVYDAGGTLIKKYHKSDLYDHAAEDDVSLVTDERALEMAYSVVNYPTTVEIIYEKDDNSSIGIGGWLIESSEQSIQNTICRVSVKPDAGFRYLNKNTNLKPQKNTSNDRDVYTWETKNLKAFKLEKGVMKWKVLPIIDFYQNKFEYYGVPGDIDSWQNYGKFQQALNADVSTLSPGRVAEIRKMTDTIKSDKEKARFLYKYMQDNMRYVSVQLGIGGFKPFAATFVDEKKYGDCKALSNYMRALLKAVDINSYYAEINAGTNGEPANYSFPYDPFNHVILCVPFKNDTTWLECTSSINPFGQLGTFTENRNALIITEDGGKLVSTPKSTAQENQFISEAHIKLEADGSAKTQIKILSSGEYRFEYISVLAAKMDRQKRFWLEELGIKQPSAFDFKYGDDKNGTKQIDLDLEYDKFCDIMAGDKQFYRPLAFLLWDSTVPVLEKRKTDYFWEYPSNKSCVTTIDLPTGFEVETLPANTNLKFTYGNYEINYVYNKDKNQVVSTAKFVLNNHVIPATKYTEMQQYMDAIAKAQNKKLVIKKKA